jgi:hypothetical protein
MFHYTPNSGSWLNAAETLFAELARRRLQCGSFHSPDVTAVRWPKLIEV